MELRDQLMKWAEDGYHVAIYPELSDRRKDGTRNVNWRIDVWFDEYKIGKAKDGSDVILRRSQVDRVGRGRMDDMLRATDLFILGHKATTATYLRQHEGVPMEPVRSEY